MRYELHLSLLLFSSLLLWGCRVCHDPNPAAVSWDSRIREHVLLEKPQFNPETKLDVQVLHFDDSGDFNDSDDSSGLQLLHVRYLSPDGQLFKEESLVAHGEDLHTLGKSFGGFGLMSAVKVGDAIYYTYSWGSGIHRSHVGELSVVSGELMIRESGGFANADLFVRTAEGGVLVEAGDFESFNNWKSAEPLGVVGVAGTSLRIVDSHGIEQTPPFVAQ